MPAYEVAKSRHTTRRLDKKHTHSRTYVVNNPTSAGAMADAISAAPPEVIIDSKYLRITDIDTEETDHPDWFMASVSWATKDSRQSKEATQPTETNDYEESFTIGGGTEQIQEAFSQTKYGDNSADLGNSINVGDDGSVSGIDIVIPLMTFTSVHYLPDTVVDETYILNLRDAVGKTNSDTFRGYTAGELLLLSASGSKRGEEDWQITFDFSAGKNRTGLTVAGITGVTKNAHDYLWVQYEQEQEDTAKRMKPAAVGVYVAVVYEAAAFGTTLRI